MKVVLATQNKGKMKEMKALFNSMPIELVMLSDYCLDDIEETGLTFVENALLKARFASEKSGLPAIADDSGLVVPALNGEPGIYSARYAGISATDEDNIQLLLKKMASLTEDQRAAYFFCAIALVKHALDPTPIIATGLFRGSIVRQQIG